MQPAACPSDHILFIAANTPTVCCVPFHTLYCRRHDGGPVSPPTAAAGTSDSVCVCSMDGSLSNSSKLQQKHGGSTSSSSIQLCSPAGPGLSPECSRLLAAAVDEGPAVTAAQGKLPVNPTAAPLDLQSCCGNLLGRFGLSKSFRGSMLGLSWCGYWVRQQLPVSPPSSSTAPAATGALGQAADLEGDDVNIGSPMQGTPA